MAGHTKDPATLTTLRTGFTQPLLKADITQLCRESPGNWRALGLWISADLPSGPVVNGQADLQEDPTREQVCAPLDHQSDATAPAGKSPHARPSAPPATTAARLQLSVDPHWSDQPCSCGPPAGSGRSPARC